MVWSLLKPNIEVILTFESLTFPGSLEVVFGSFQGSDAGIVTAGRGENRPRMAERSRNNYQMADDFNILQEVKMTSYSWILMQIYYF